ncbi:hypothetical protein DOTSEDRAFT_33959 [Dothistroma septosporum NZE10]|uniref:Uncharacterized protein n=1 Tax=Dothistroma septosporum (strain NZE10 / CBS 128990) TaxID=675120 RepID=N1PSR3_DOTSN|nr:hypothetical protein DOTSEDRAFT_33959 [Dothistroma septosporum NZE10]
MQHSLYHVLYQLLAAMVLTQISMACPGLAGTCESGGECDVPRVGWKCAAQGPRARGNDLDMPPLDHEMQGQDINDMQKCERRDSESKDASLWKDTPSTSLVCKQMMKHIKGGPIRPHAHESVSLARSIIVFLAAAVVRRTEDAVLAAV